MKKQLLFIFFIICWYVPAAQDLPFTNHYLMEPYTLNPAMAGTSNYLPLSIIDRHQWLGIPNAPQTQILTAHLGIKKNGMGIQIMNDKNGDMQLHGVQLTYAYHLTFRKYRRIRRRSGKIYKNRPHLSFGISFSTFQLNLDQRSIMGQFANDPAISQGIETAYFPDANVGIYFTSKGFFTGLSANQLFEASINLYDRNNEPNRLKRHYFLQLGKKQGRTDDYAVEPSFLLKSDENLQMRVDLNFKMYYQNDYWLIFSYRRNLNTLLEPHNSMKIFFGIRLLKRFHTAYAFEHMMSGIQNSSQGTHELMIQYRFGEKFSRF